MTQENVTCRRATNNDADTIGRILKTILAEYEIQLPDNYSFADVEKLEGIYIDSGGEFKVLLRDEEIIGFFALLPADNNQVELKRLYLTAAERGKGLGKYLLEMALNRAQEGGHHRIYLETTSRFKEAVAMYLKNGFKTNSGATLSEGHDIGLVKEL